MGNTQNGYVDLSNGKDHPHMRGEYIPAKGVKSFLVGSPPHAWGILGSAGQSFV